jgi:hypothetical protein
MKLKHVKLPFTKLPPDLDLTLFLIREELKSEKFFHGLYKVGIDDCYFQTRLGKVILGRLGMDDGSDEIFNFYHSLIEKRSKKIEANNDSVMKQAIKVYAELIAEKKRRKDLTNK